MRIFTILKKLCTKLGLIADYVMETGTDGIWTYRKWNSGVAECWGSKTVTPTSTYTWGSLYEVRPVVQENFPSRLFKEIEYFNAAATSANMAFSGVEQYQAVTTTKTPQLVALRPSSITLSSTSRIKYTIYAKGRWK